MTGQKIINKMMEKDYFSQWLGIIVMSSDNGSCKLSLTIRKDMLNGFGIAHGGITYSLADSALAFASNASGRKCVSIETSISHVKSLTEGEEIIAEATCETQTEKLGHYSIKIYRKTDPETIVALFKGLVYKTSKEWLD